ncbi:MAG: RNA pseudouridine synthase [Verrucomicrobiae bacterium]|nr:RNA pseudouridine synthase [Verrucomicrobiae bacterium]
MHGRFALIRVGTPDVFQVDKHTYSLARLRELRNDFFHDPDFAVLDETEDYIVVNKPAHLLVHPSKPGNPPTLLDGLEGLLAFDIANGARLSIINRLDRDTSGIVLITKNPKAARLFCIAMERRQFKKGYQAIVYGWPESEEFEVDAPLRRKGEVTPSPIWLKQIIHPDGATSRTRFKVLQRFEHHGQRFSLIEANPITGRMHQIRVHLQHTGHSIVGDKIYGPSEDWYLQFIDDGWSEEMEHALLMKRHALHAFRLTLPEHDLHWEAPLPTDMRDFVATGLG